MKYLKAHTFQTKVIVSLILLALFAYSAYSYVWPKYVQWKEDREVQIVKTKVEKIETFGSQNRYVFYKTSRPNGSYVLSNHFSSFLHKLFRLNEGLVLLRQFYLQTHIRRL